MQKKAYMIGRHWICLGFIATLIGCQTLPEQKDRTESNYLTDVSNTRLGRVLEPQVQQNTPFDGIYELEDPYDAFVARAVLIASADKSLDLQYYIWHPDTSGKMLFNEVYEAAERGVRVRLLLDDNNTRGMDDILAALTAHPNIEVRLFNPFTNRIMRSLGYVTDFKRLNHRMHNKSLIVDNQIAVIGGRNIGDEYFAAGDGMVFADMDVITIGPVVTELSKDFDKYWASELSYPFKDIVTVRKNKEYADKLFDQARVKFRADKKQYLEALQKSNLAEAIKEQNIQWHWSKTHLISDDPAKAMASSKENIPYFTQRLDETLGEPQEFILFVSPYFVPTELGVQALRDIKENDNVRVAVLTNSLEATDVSAVHSGYARYRRDLLKSGVELFELKKLYSGDVPTGKDKGLVGSSASSLHAKTFVIDNQRVFVGSLNLDPRSAWINTEMGLVIDNPDLAKQMAESLLVRLPERAYEVKLQENEKDLEWISYDANQEKKQVYDSEPNVGIFKRAVVKFLSWLPIEGLL